MNYLKKHIPIFSVILSAVVAWLLVPLGDGPPMLAFSIFFIGLGSLVYLFRRDRTWFDTVLYLGIVALSIFLLIGADVVMPFINFLFIIFFGSLLILPMNIKHTVWDLITKPIAAINEGLTRKNIFPYSWTFLKKFNKTDSLRRVVPSLLITLLFLGITIPLLSSANPFFNQLVQNILQFFNLTQFERFFTADHITMNAFRVVLLILLAYVTPRILTASTEEVKSPELNISLPVNYLYPKVAMGILLIIFFVTQAQLYFAAPELLQSMGYTNSRLTNEVFAQVTLVAFIIFFLAYLDKSRKTWNKVLTYFLVTEAFFLVGIAFKSVYDYSSLYGFTQKRLWGYATMSWLTGALLIFTYFYAKSAQYLSFFRSILTLTILVLLGINLANFDYLIAHYSKARTQAGTDYVYLSKRSPDAHYYKETLMALSDQTEKSTTYESKKVLAAYRVLHKIEVLKQKYGVENQLNSWNYSEYQEYLNVKDINTDVYRKKLSAVEAKFNQPATPQIPAED